MVTATETTLLIRRMVPAYAGVAARGLAGTFLRDDARTGAWSQCERVFLRREVANLEYYI